MNKEQLKHLPRIKTSIFDRSPKKAVELAEIVIETQEEIHPKGESFAEAVTNAHGITNYDIKMSVYVIGFHEEAKSLVFGNECVNQDNNIVKRYSEKLSEIKGYRVLEKLG
jgi:hypothetical protein